MRGKGRERERHTERYTYRTGQREKEKEMQRVEGDGRLGKLRIFVILHDHPQAEGSTAQNSSLGRGELMPCHPCDHLPRAFSSREVNKHGSTLGRALTV